MGLGNPVPGRIQGINEKWKGKPTFRVTARFGQVDRFHPTPHEGVDFGNGRIGDPVYASEAGVIVQAYKDPGNGALIVRQRIPKYVGMIVGYAHMNRYHVSVGQSVRRGQMIGVVGMSGASAPHLHWGVNVNGHEVDGWKLLDQNIKEPDVIHTVDRVLYQDASGKPAARKVNIKAGTYTGYTVLGKKKKATVGNTSCSARSICTITHLPDADPHGPGWLEIVDGIWAGYYLRTGPLDPGINPE